MANQSPRKKVFSGPNLIATLAKSISSNTLSAFKGGWEGNNPPRLILLPPRFWNTK